LYIAALDFLAYLRLFGPQPNPVIIMVNFGNVLQYLSLQSPQQILSGDQLNATKMEIAKYTLPQLPYSYHVSK
jgi:hypothetical protein